MNKQFLTVDAGQQRNRTRSERAASLALPLNSLLDFYDKQQEQCKSVTLLPTSINSIVRRHSSHYYPMLEDKQQQQQQQLLPQQLPLEHPSSLLLNMAEQKYCKSARPTLPRVDTPVTPPPPIPRRVLRGKSSAWQTSSDIYMNATVASLQQQQQQMQREREQREEAHSVFVYPLTNVGNEGRQSATFADVDGISDDDRMSLENSVFDESLTCTPVKVNRYMSATARANAEMNHGLNQRESHLAKRAQRSSSSTVDSSATICSTISSGYGSSNHSERFASTSTTADFRSRFSSVDTQSSLDGSSLLAESKLQDSPLPITNMNNNELNNNININYNNNSRGVLPAVPARKVVYKSQPQFPPPSSSSSGGDSLKDSSSVSASASTSSAASAGSSTISSSTLSSISLAANQKLRPVPPAPPQRVQQSLPEAVAPLPPPISLRNKLSKKPPPIVYPKLQQRQDSTLSSDSYSLSSSPGYNSKLMETPLLQAATRKCSPGIHAASKLSKLNFRQDSNISSDSFSQTSSPGYNSKLMEAPLLPAGCLSAKRLCSAPAPIVCRQNQLQHEPIEELEAPQTLSPLSKLAATPNSLPTIVRFQNGAPHTMSLQHQIIQRRKSSNPYITNGRLKFRLFQILINAFALLAIAGGLAAYFNAYPTIKFVNKTIINTIHVEDTSSYGKNPAPGTCLPIIVKFCQGSQIPYNYTVFPNYIGHFGQLETQVDLDSYEALVDVRCYELVSLFLCTLFVPKCGATGATVPPCKTLCTETMRRCGFFFDVFGLSLPEYLNCKLFKDFSSAEDCVGLDEVRDVMIAAANPKCLGFQCDQNRCLPKEYVCDGHLDCMDQADEAKCERCEADEIYCGDDRCIGTKHICNGIIDCPYGQDERNCLRLSDRNGDIGSGVLEVFRISMRQWMPACVKNWDRAVSPSAVCSILGYSAVNATSVVTQRTHRPLLASVNVSTDIWKMYAKKRSTLMQEFSTCKQTEDYPIAELTCSNYECGKVKRGRHKPSRRIIGGSQSNPGNWPFLAAILGGPEKIFYCAGVLISDQWVLTASHCVGNHTVIDLEDWTIQLGVTRRNSFTYTGQKVKVKAVIPHPQYNMAIAHDNDIALFQLATRVAFHEHLLPVCLPPPNVKYLRPEQLCTVIGWGKREDKDPKSTYEFIVNEVQVPIIRRAQCDEWLDNLTVSEGMVCAGYDDGGKDACQGDSGGPLLCPYPGEKDRWFVGGIVSWGIMCAHPKLPGVYANVIKYVPWIQEQMLKHSRPSNDDRVAKYDLHPGGPDILSKMTSGPIRNRKPYYYHNGKPMGIDYYDSDEKK